MPSSRIVSCQIGSCLRFLSRASRGPAGGRRSRTKRVESEDRAGSPSAVGPGVPGPSAGVSARSSEVTRAEPNQSLVVVRLTPRGAP